MFSIDFLINEINECVSFCVKEAICHNQLYPHRKGLEIIPEGGNPGTMKFHNIQEYLNWLSEIIKNNQFEFILFDGSVISFSYSFENHATIREMRCVYLPNITILPYEYYNEISEEELELLNNTEGSFFYLPLRFDFKNPDFIAEGKDPYCHLHLGFLEDCRLPIKAPITPKAFILFILENFYPKRFSKIEDKSFFNLRKEDVFIPKIKDIDSKRFHLNMEI